MKIISTVFLLVFFQIIGFAQLQEINSPIKNFDALWNKFDERYANFDLKQVDWDKIYKTYRPLIDEQTTNQELFEVCCTMLQELKDGHVRIEPDFEESDIECGPPYEFQLELEFDTAEKQKAFEAVIEKELSNQGFSSSTSPTITEATNFQARVSNDFAYLRLDEMTEAITFGKFKKTLDNAILSFQKKKGLIIDLRFNGGGFDYIGYILASRFVPKNKTIGHYERKRIKGENTYTPMKYKEVKSKGTYQFTKPIVILMSDYTASAAEVFILLMRELPNVTLIGDRTEGIFSDMYEFKLPNKWQVSLSHQQYFSSTKENFEGKGISPDIKVLNTNNDIQNQEDAVLQTAINYLKK